MARVWMWTRSWYCGSSRDLDKNEIAFIDKRREHFGLLRSCPYLSNSLAHCVKR